MLTKCSVNIVELNIDQYDNTMALDPKIPFKLKLYKCTYSFGSALEWPWAVDLTPLGFTFSTIKGGLWVRGTFQVLKFWNFLIFFASMRAACGSTQIFLLGLIKRFLISLYDKCSGVVFTKPWFKYLKNSYSFVFYWVN